LKPEFWTQIHVALQQLADESSETDTLISEDQKRTLSQWQQISKAKNVISSDMNLTEFPAVPLMAFPLIECLDLSGNTIRFLPNDWSQFKSLSTLDVSRNLIDILPGSVAAHPTLKNFIFRDNPLRLLPPSLVSSLLPIDRPQAQQWIKAGKHGSGSGSAQQVSPSTHRRGKDSFPSSSSNTDDSKAFASTKAPLSLDTMAPSFDWTKTPVFKYLTEMSSGQEQMISDSKVRINVHGERYTDRRLLQNTLQVDFGSFVTRLRYKVPVIQPSDDITIQDFTNKFTPQDVSFETWTSGARHADFASQVLITPGIQLVLFSLLRPDARELEKVSYWLQAIAARAPTSPVILVACHCEALVSNSRDVTALMERVTSLATSTLSASCFDAHSDVVPVSFANGEGMDALKRRFADIVNRHALANKTYPKPLTQLVQTILMLKGARWFLSRRELSDLAMQFGIDVSHKESFASIVQQLSALGGLLYFGDANPRLADVVFTDPQRLCNALTNFAGRHKRLIKDGLLYMQDCDPNIVSILNGIPVLPESSSNSGQTVSSPSVSPTATIHSGPPSPQPVSKSSSGFGSSPVVEQTSPSSGKNPRSSSEPPVAATQSTGAIATSSSTPQSSENVEAVVRSSTRNSKGFLTSPIKPVAKSASSLSTTSPLIGRARIDDGVLVDILELFEEAVKLPNESVLLPRLLTDAVPEELLHQYWTQGLAHSFERVYQFSGAAIPKRLLNNFYRQIYEDQHLEVCLHWSQGVVLRYLGERAQITTPNPATIHIKVAGELPSRILTMVVSMMDDLISTFAPSLLAQVLIPCPSLSAASTTLRLNELLDALCDGESQITRGRTSIRLGLVAPDLCMQELQTLEAEESAFTTEAGLSVDSALEILESASTVSIVPSTSSSSAASTNTSAISSIGSASSDLVYALDGKTVWRGKLRGAEDVHVAYFHKSVQPAAFKTKEEFMEAASLSYLRGLTALCAEARLLNALQHPNMVRLKAFNMASQTLATEAPSHGTLRSFLGSSPSSFTPELKLRMMHELAQTVAWMHGNNVAHGALSPDSVLVTSLDVNPQHVHVKLCNLNQAVRTSTHPEAELKDKRDLATLFAQIWNGNLEGRPLDASSASSFSSTSASQSDEQQQMPQQFSSTTQLSLEISELISSCSSNLAGSHPIAIKEIIQHIEYLFAMQNWLLSVPLKLSMKNLSVSAHRYWKLENSIRIIDLNEREIASISSIVRASDGQVWIACASGYIHVWNNPGSGLQKDRNQPIKSVIQTYSIDTRQSRRRINALMPSGSYVWCITDGSICVYANDGQLVKSITHKQSLCITKYQSSSSLSSSSSSLPLRTNPGDGMVYIGGAHGEISVWDSSTMQCTLGVVLENRLPITAIAADSRYLWIGVGVSRRICHVVALNKQTLNEIFRFQAHDDLISSIVVVDDTHLWTSSFDGKINVWNITAENENKVGVRLEKSLMTHRRPILKMTSGPRNADHSTDRVYASDNSGIFIWDTKQHHLIHKHLVGRHRGAIGALESIDTGSFLSASVEDGCVCLWKQCHSMSQ
jgi:serine/threonine protein kinase